MSTHRCFAIRDTTTGEYHGADSKDINDAERFSALEADAECDGPHLEIVPVIPADLSKANRHLLPR